MKNTEPPGFIRINRAWWISEVWRRLSPNGRVVLTDMLYRFTGRNNGHIGYSASDAGRILNASKKTGHRAIVELQSAGLIEPTVKGSFSIKTGEIKGAPTTWRLTFV